MKIVQRNQRALEDQENTSNPSSKLINCIVKSHYVRTEERLKVYNIDRRSHRESIGKRQ